MSLIVRIITYSAQTFLKGRSGKSDVCFPEAVQIAVLIGCHILFAIGEHKLCDRRLARGKILSHDALRGLDRDEIDIVLLQHRVLDFTDLHRDLVPVHRDDRNVLFICRIGRVRDELLKRLTASLHRACAFLKQFHHVSALFADKDLHKSLLMNYL